MRILIVDDEKNVTDTLALILKHAGHEVRCAYSSSAALAVLNSFAPECAICDLILTGSNGPGPNSIDMCASLAAACPQCLILLSSGQSESSELVQDARTRGFSWELLVKPQDPIELLKKLASLESARRSPSALASSSTG
jgi:two-component system, OmpR family, phosphate regulon response regulator PhoB